MKKFFAFISLISLSFLATSSYAQFQKGDKLLNAGVGLGAYYGGGIPLGASFEVGITEDISVGGQVDYYSWNYTWGAGPYSYGYNYTFIPVAARGSYHFNRVLNINNNNFDLYGGAALGYYISSFKYKDGTGAPLNYDNGYGNRVLFGVHVGSRYYFKENLGAFAELGYGVSTLKLGVTFKF